MYAWEHERGRAWCWHKLSSGVPECQIILWCSVRLVGRIMPQNWVKLEGLSILYFKILYNHSTPAKWALSKSIQFHKIWKPVGSWTCQFSKNCPANLNALCRTVGVDIQWHSWLTGLLMVIFQIYYCQFITINKKYILLVLPLGVHNSGDLCMPFVVGWWSRVWHSGKGVTIYYVMGNSVFYVKPA